MSYLYNPLRGSEIYLYPQDRDVRNPRIGILHTQPVETADDEKILVATAFKGKVVVKINEARQIEVFVNGKKTNRYSIKFAGRKQKRVWGSH